MHVESNMESVFGVPQQFMKHTGTKIEVLVAKVTDDFLVTGTKDNIEAFVNGLKDEFDVGQISIAGSFRFKRCEIKTTYGYAELSMNHYVKKIEELPISRKRKCELESQATKLEEKITAPSPELSFIMKRRTPTSGADEVKNATKAGIHTFESNLPR